MVDVITLLLDALQSAKRRILGQPKVKTKETFSFQIGFVYTIGIILIVSFLALLFNPSNEKQTKKEMSKIIEKASEFHHLSGSYPTELGLLVKKRPNRKDWLFDEWGTPYEIISASDFKLISAGPDKSMNTADDLILKCP